MKNIYLIDYENVGISWTKEISKDKITLKDEFILFLRTDENLSKDTLQVINNYLCNFRIMKTQINKKNSVDFLISCFIIDNIDIYENIYIVSNDNGYETVKEYIENIKGKKIKLKKICSEKKYEDLICKEIYDFILYNHRDKKDFIFNLILSPCKENKKNFIHNELKNKYGNTGKLIYDCIKNKL